MINKILAWTILVFTILVFIYLLTSDLTASFPLQVFYFGSVVYITIKYIESLKK